MTEAAWRQGAWEYWIERGTFKGYPDWTDPSDGKVYTIRKNSNFNPDKKTGIKKADKAKKAGYLAERNKLINQNKLKLKDFVDAVNLEIERRIKQGFPNAADEIDPDLAKKSFKLYQQTLNKHLRDIRASIVEGYKGTAGHLLDPADPRSLEIIENYIPEPGGGPGGNFASQNKRVASDEALEALGIPLNTKGKATQKIVAAEHFMFGGQRMGRYLNNSEQLDILRGKDVEEVTSAAKERISQSSPRHLYETDSIKKSAKRGFEIVYDNGAIRLVKSAIRNPLVRAGAVGVGVGLSTLNAGMVRAETQGDDSALAKTRRGLADAEVALDAATVGLGATVIGLPAAAVTEVASGVVGLTAMGVDAFITNAERADEAVKRGGRLSFNTNGINFILPELGISERLGFN